jgi:glutamyl-tRNA synthetase
MTVRTRIAPSPTGDPHVGTAFVALFNYCFARSQGGRFLLRIEDTDQVRSTSESERMILEALRWIGLSWDEGPDVGGPNGPYRQSDRSEIYREHAEILLEKGHAFRCFCTGDELAALRAEQKAKNLTPGYDGRCSRLSKDEVRARVARGQAHVVRMLVPREGQCTIQDRLRGPVVIDWAGVDMQVLLKSDGLPTYHMANVVDDHLMGITHVMRGEEWINSAPKHLLLYDYFGWQAPQLCHLPLLRNPDRSKLSKRKNPTSILWYRRMGYLPEALLNYLGQVAWSMPDGSELFDLPTMVQHFDIDRLSLGGPVFDLTKLGWVNAQWIRERQTEEQFIEQVRRWAFNEDYLRKVALLSRSRVQTLGDLGTLSSFFFSGGIELTEAQLLGAKVDRELMRRALQFGVWTLNALPEWRREAIDAALRGLAERMGSKPRDFLRPFYVAITGRTASVPLFDAMELLGRDLCRHRLNKAVELLGTPKGKEAEAWEKEYASWQAPASAEEG